LHGPPVFGEPNPGPDRRNRANTALYLPADCRRAEMTIIRHCAYGEKRRNPEENPQSARTNHLHFSALIVIFAIPAMNSKP
jgi:hypothetical protein